MKNKLIAIDDDPLILGLIHVTLEKQNFEVITTTNPYDGLNLFLEDPTLVIVSDLSMPEMSGADLMQKIFDHGHEPIFIILTSHTDVKMVVELFKQGVHDYIIKPFKHAELVNRVSKAFEFAELRMIKENIKKEREIRNEHQLNWNLYKESLIKKDSDKTDSGLMANINTNLIQGAGLGTLASLAARLKKNSKLDGDNYIIKKSLMDMLYDNIDVSSKLISIVNDIDKVISRELLRETILLGEIPKIFHEVILENQKYQDLKGHQVKLSENKFENNTHCVSINIEYFKKVIQELLRNAFKFSEPNSKVYILFEILKKNFQISFLNSPTNNSKEAAGIPPEYHHIIFEPFFRLSKFVFESYDTLDYGLGLCYVDKIVRNHKGKISISNLKNFLENNKSILINFTIEIPIVE